MIPQTSGKRLVVAQAYIYQLLPGVGDAAALRSEATEGLARLVRLAQGQ
jgi:hypothetical protein